MENLRMELGSVCSTKDPVVMFTVCQDWDLNVA